MGYIAVDGRMVQYNTLLPGDVGSIPSRAMYSTFSMTSRRMLEAPLSLGEAHSSVGRHKSVSGRDLTDLLIDACRCLMKPRGHH